MKPTISVIMPVRNGAPFLTEAVRSILSQSFQNFEFLICDDASSDNTFMMLKTFQDPRMRIFPHARKQGVAASLNTLWRKAKGEFLARMDADDIAHKDRLKIQVAFLQANPEIGLVGSWFEEFDRGKRRLVKFPSAHADIRRVLPQFNPIRHPTIMIRRSVMNTSRKYDESLEGAEDYDLVIRASKVTKLANIQKPLLIYRVSAQSVSVAETQRILFRALLARWKALLSGDFHWWESMFLLKPLVSLMIPPTIKRWMREGF